MKMPHLFFVAMLLLISCEHKEIPVPKKVPPTKTTPDPAPSVKKGNWVEGNGFQYKILEIPKSGKTGFTLLTPEMTGVTFQNDLADEQLTKNQILQSGSGVATGDFDNDGLCDIYFCRLNGKNALYKNLGNWKFKDVAEEAGVACPDQFSSGAVFADIDGDSDLDLFVACIGKLNTCFINNGKGKFTASATSGLNENLGSMSMALADIEGDGDLDLYITNYRTSTFKDYGEDLSLYLTEEGKFLIPPQLQNRLKLDGEISIPKEDIAKFVVDGKFNIPPNYHKKLVLNRRLLEYGEMDNLYINDGNGNFKLLPFMEGNFLDEDGKPLSEKPLDWGLAVSFKDMDGDFDPDLYVCNDFWTPDRIWMNQGNQTFKAIDRLAIRSISATSMGVDFSDINRDGHDDFFVVDMMARDHKRRKMQMGAMQPTPISIGEIENRPQVMRNTLLLNRGDNTYAEIALYSETHDTEWSWAPLFLDIDLDGYEDLYVTNGHARDVQDADTMNRVQALDFQSFTQKRMALLMYPRLKTFNVAMRNTGHLKFEDKGQEWGLAQETITHGVATGDFDNDGDLDLVINNLFSPAGVYRNETIAPRIAVRLKGTAKNTQGIGAKVILSGGPVPQTKEILSGGHYLSGSDNLIMFAPGSAKEGLTLEVLWRNGTKSIVSGVQPNCLYEIHESEAQPFEMPEPTPITPTFTDVSDKIAHIHSEAGFDDFAYQSMLPNRFSQFGPGVAWADVNQDQHEDLIVGSGRSGSLAIFYNDGQGNFKRETAEPVNTTVVRDHTAIAAYKNEKGASCLLIGSSNFEDASTEGAAVLCYEFQDGKSDLHNVVPCQPSSTGPIALADIDGDGDLDLFVGDRTLAKRYPEAVSSRIFLNQEGVYTLDTNNSAKLEKIGLVSGATFSDLDSDGDADLILAMEWGPITVFLNDKGILENATQKLGFAPYSGWWNSVTIGDLNNDGRLDVIAMNWGLNSKYHLSKEHPLQVFYKDFDENGVLDIVEAHYDHRMHTIVPERGLSCSSRAMPFIKETKGITTYEKYGSCSLKDIYGDDIFKAPVLSANDLTHKIFINRGDRFEAIELPTETQLTPGFGICVADYNGDGADDIFIAQNFSAAQIETPRIDAGRGLWLKGNGKGNFTPVPGQHSGIKVYGDSRGAAVGDFNADGRIDLVVAQNGAATKFYENTQAVPGLRIRLVGTPKNPSAIGAVCRLLRDQSQGPARELHAGGGYWSQDSLVQVMSPPAGQGKVKLWVRWSGGQEATVDVPEGAKEIQLLQENGMLTVIK